MSFLCHLAPLVLIQTIFRLQLTMSLAKPDDYGYVNRPLSFRENYYGYRYHTLGGDEGPPPLDERVYHTESESEERVKVDRASGEVGTYNNSNDDTPQQPSEGLITGRNFPDFRSTSSGEIKYLILDRKCELLGSLFGTTNCWMDLAKGEQLEQYVWVMGGKIKLLVHGFTTKEKNVGDDALERQGILKLGEEYDSGTNVIGVDWSVNAASNSYPEAASSVVKTGEQVASFLVSVQERNNFAPRDFWNKLHCIGFSLGAHVCGVVGHALQTGNQVKISRITGLDAAGPEFDAPYGTWPSDRSGSLDKNDARFVDVIHCNMGTPLGWITAFIIGKYGSWLERGTADFYPNAGERQSPYCTRVEDIRGCSHNMCVNYFTESIRRENYMACGCSSWEKHQAGKCDCGQSTTTLMGERVALGATGNFFLKINRW